MRVYGFISPGASIMPLRSDAKADDAHSWGVRVLPRRSMFTLLWSGMLATLISNTKYAHAQVQHLSPALELLIWISTRAELLVML